MQHPLISYSLAVSIQKPPQNTPASQLISLVLYPPKYGIASKKVRREESSSLLKQACSHLFCDDGLDNLDLTAVVVTALLAHSVRQVQRTAFGACNETGDRQLPVRAAALVASCFGYFSLRYCHCDTSLIIQRPGSVARPY